MMTVLIIISLPFLIAAMAMIISVPLTIVDYLEEFYYKTVECIQLHKIRKAERKRLAHEIEVWTIIAKDCDSDSQAEEKGYAIARLVNYHHQLDMID